MKLKTEARSVEKFRELNKGMEVKLMQLQLRADQEVGGRLLIRPSCDLSERYLDMIGMSRPGRVQR